VTNDIPYWCSVILPVHTVNRVQTLKATASAKHRIGLATRARHANANTSVNASISANTGANTNITSGANHAHTNADLSQNDVDSAAATPTAPHHLLCEAVGEPLLGPFNLQHHVELHTVGFSVGRPLLELVRSRQDLKIVKCSFCAIDSLTLCMDSAPLILTLCMDSAPLILTLCMDSAPLILTLCMDSACVVSTI
jgi:hypothetical protein